MHQPRFILQTIGATLVGIDAFGSSTGRFV